MTVQNPVSEKAISVTELNATIAACMDAPVFKGLEVYGEVSGGRVSGGHFYFTLKDKNSEMPCVKFRAAGTYIPADGESVVLRGGMNFWTARKRTKCPSPSSRSQCSSSPRRRARSSATS